MEELVDPDPELLHGGRRLVHVGLVKARVV